MFVCLTATQVQSWPSFWSTSTDVIGGGKTHSVLHFSSLYKLKNKSLAAKVSHNDSSSWGTFKCVCKEHRCKVNAWPRLPPHGVTTMTKYDAFPVKSIIFYGLKSHLVIFRYTGKCTRLPQGSCILDGCVIRTAVMAYILTLRSLLPRGSPTFLAHRWAKKGSPAFTWPLLNVKNCDTKWSGFIFV